MLIQLQQNAIQAIKHSYAVLTKEQDLSPENMRVTESLTRLVRTLTQCQSPELVKFLLDTPDLAVEREHLPVLCGQAECEMEKFWSRKLLACKNCDLTDFWYFDEYIELCQAELDLFQEKKFDRISFLGSGALPLTAFLLARSCPDTPVVCVDFDTEACELSQKLCDRIGLSDQISIIQSDALSYTPVQNELVICASLLQGREAVYTHLDQFDCALIVRDSEGPYQYLYKPAELPQIAKHHFAEVSKTTVNPKRINTSRYFEKTEASHVA